VSGGSVSLDLTHAGGIGAPAFVDPSGPFRRFPRLPLTAYRSGCSLDDPVYECKAKYEYRHYPIHREERRIQPREIPRSHQVMLVR
jgi:hypothetical protein